VSIQMTFCKLQAGHNTLVSIN